jgi:hypothetical protein
VTELGDLLELLHGAEEPFQSLAVTWRVWRHHERSHRAFLAWAERSGGQVATAYGPGQEPDESTETVREWREGDKVREEDSRDGAYAVRVGEIWWRWHPLRGAMSNEDDRGTGGVGERHSVWLSPARLLGVLRLRVVGAGEVARRATIEVEAIPRAVTAGDPPWFELHELGPGAERYVLQVDAERGLLLAASAFFEGEPFQVKEAVEIVFDEPIDPERFVFVAPSGERIHAPGDRGLHHERVPLVEAQQRATFTVLMPSEVPEGWRLRCHYIEAIERPPMTETVSLFYHSASGHESVSISQSAAAGIDPTFASLTGLEDWEAREGGIHVRDPGGQAQAHLQWGGTFVFMSSDTLGVERLARLAANLIPAPYEDSS